MKYPKIDRSDYSEIIHGEEILDPYRFMENEDEQTSQWTVANNELLESYLDMSQKQYFQSRLEEIVSFDKYSDVEERSGRIFYKKQEGIELQPSLFYRDGLYGEENLIMDFSSLSEDGTLAPTTISYSDSGKYTTICLSQSGSDWQEMVVIESETGKEVDRLQDLRFSSPSWTKEEDKFYYTKFPSGTDDFERTSENGAIYLHVLGQPQSEDIEVFSHEDSRETPNAKLSPDNNKLVISSYYSSGMGNKLAMLDIESGELTKIHDSYTGNSFEIIKITNSHCYLKTNDQAPRNKIIKLSMSVPELDEAVIVVPESNNLIESVAIGGDYLFVMYLINAVSVIKQFTLEGDYIGELELPQMGTVLHMSARSDSNNFFYIHTSYPYLPQIYHFDILEGRTTKVFDNRSDFDANKYTLKQVFFSSADGTELSMFIIHRSDLELDGSNPCLLWSYGGFNVSLTPGAGLRERYKVRLMIEEGGVYACPNIRGGGEYGREWHKAGTKERKQNVFDDFIASAEYLIDQGYTSKNLIVSHGGSNGGLLVAATMLQRPDLWGAAVAEAGVMDMLRYHKFTFGKYWIGDYGNPDNQEDFQFLKEYSPVHNVKSQSYPPALFYCADTDTRVVPMHTKKLVAELQHKQQGNNPILLRTERKAGHNFGKPLNKVIEETAIMFAFVWKVLKIPIK